MWEQGDVMDEDAEAALVFKISLSQDEGGNGVSVRISMAARKRDSVPLRELLWLAEEEGGKQVARIQRLQSIEKP